MPVAAVSGLIFDAYTVYAPDREVIYALARKKILAGEMHFFSCAGVDVDVIHVEALTYLRERAVLSGFGIASNGDATFTITLGG